MVPARLSRAPNHNMVRCQSYSEDIPKPHGFLKMLSYLRSRNQSRSGTTTPSKFPLIFLSTFMLVLFSINNETVINRVQTLQSRGEIFRPIEGTELVWEDKVLVLPQARVEKPEPQQASSPEDRSAGWCLCSRGVAANDPRAVAKQLPSALTRNLNLPSYLRPCSAFVVDG